jgi:hypothetical protein
MLFVIAAMLPPPPAPPTLSVQLVTIGWLPTPGVQVTVQRVENCQAPLPKGVEDVRRGLTNKSGVALFPVTGPADYQIAVRAQAGFNATSKCVHVLEMIPGDVPSVQLRLDIQTIR